MNHFGQGGFMDYMLGELSFLRAGGRDIYPVTGQHSKGDGGYNYDAPFFWWDIIIVRFSHAIHYDGLKCNRQELRI